MPELEPVTPEASSVPREMPRVGLFGATKCERLDFRYRVTRDKFDVDRFLAFFKQTQEQDGVVFCRTLEPDSLDYHIHFNWYFIKQSVIFYVSFHSGTLDKQESEHEPYAETFMSWFGEFFTDGDAHADMHSEFNYSVEERQSRFPLPLKVDISDDLEAEIVGMSMLFTSMPDGNTGANVKQGKKRLNVELSGITRTTFATFDLHGELNRLSSFALRLTKVRDTK